MRRATKTFLALATGLTLLPVMATAASSALHGLAFTPGLWCGKGAFQGNLETIGGVVLTLESRKMEFQLGVEKNGKVGGQSQLDVVMNAEGKFKSQQGSAVHGQFRISGDFDVDGPATGPTVTGAWLIKGVILVESHGKTVEVPYERTTKPPPSHLVIESITHPGRTRAEGRWLPKWHWVAYAAVSKGNAINC